MHVLDLLLVLTWLAFNLMWTYFTVRGKAISIFGRFQAFQVAGLKILAGVIGIYFFLSRVTSDTSCLWPAAQIAAKKTTPHAGYLNLTKQ
jgi:hypothetical protein